MGPLDAHEDYVTGRGANHRASLMERKRAFPSGRGNFVAVVFHSGALVAPSPHIQLEKIIEKGISHFVEVGTALMLIKQEKLYRLLFSTFEEYCQERWGFNRDYANKMIRSAAVTKNLDTMVSKPTSDSLKGERRDGK
jgi:hypothetical protein